MNEMYKKQVALLIRIMPSIYGIKDFAVHGGTAINLFVRDMPQFDELKPSGIYSKEIICCLKKFNRKYREVNDWYAKAPNMKSKYNMSFDYMPSE